MPPAFSFFSHLECCCFWGCLLLSRQEKLLWRFSHPAPTTISSKPSHLQPKDIFKKVDLFYFIWGFFLRGGWKTDRLRSSLMKAFELWISGVGSNCSASCAITRALHLLCFLFLALTTCYLHNWHKEDFFTSVSTIWNYYKKNHCDWSNPANLGQRKTFLGNWDWISFLFKRTGSFSGSHWLPSTKFFFTGWNWVHLTKRDV